MTGKLVEVLAFVRAYVSEHHFPPTCVEIGDRFNVSRMSASRYLKSLEAADVIRRTPRMPRSLVFVEPGKEAPFDRQLVRAIVEACLEVKEAGDDTGRINQVMGGLKGVADAWLSGTLRPE